MGFRGPWGTTYPTNLRIKLATMTEAQWLDYSATLRTRPLMPDFAIRDMTLEDRRAIYQFVRSLGPGGQPAPAFVPPGQNPSPPYFDLVLPPAPPLAAASASAGELEPCIICGSGLLPTVMVSPTFTSLAFLIPVMI